MNEEYEGKLILGGKCIQQEVGSHSRHSITYLMRGLEEIAVAAQPGEKVLKVKSLYDQSTEDFSVRRRR